MSDDSTKIVRLRDRVALRPLRHKVLIQRLEEATEPDWDLSQWVMLAAGWRLAEEGEGDPGDWISPSGTLCFSRDLPHPTAYVHDAIDLVPDDMRWELSSETAFVEDAHCRGFSNKGIPALDLCIAALKAREESRKFYEGDEGDARLNAAAPDLLSALEMLVEENADYMRTNNLGDPETQHTVKAARAAIAKATGADQ